MQKANRLTNTTIMEDNYDSMLYGFSTIRSVITDLTDFGTQREGRKQQHWL